MSERFKFIQTFGNNNCATSSRIIVDLHLDMVYDYHHDHYK